MSYYRVTRNIGGARKYRAWPNWQEGDFIVGKLLATYEDDYGHNGYEIQVLEANFASPEYELKNGTTTIETNDIVGINHAGSLAYKMKSLGKELGNTKRTANGDVAVDSTGLPIYEVPSGTLLMFTYRGKETLQTGRFKGKKCHLVDVGMVEAQEETAQDADI